MNRINLLVYIRVYIYPRQFVEILQIILLPLIIRATGQTR